MQNQHAAYRLKLRIRIFMAKDLFLQRRRFLKGLTSAGTAASMGLAGLSPAQAMSLRLSTGGTDCCTIIDIDRCTGCGACVSACRSRNLSRLPLPQKPIPAPTPAWIPISDWSDRRQITNRLTPYNWIYIQSCTLPASDGSRRVFMPRRCLHCLNPQCVSLCPSGAARQSLQGAAYIDENICFGDGPCQRACPWLIPQRQSGVGPYLKFAPRYIGYGLVFKCDYCHELLEQGQSPACVAACPAKAQHFGIRDEMIAQAQEMAHQRDGEIFGLKENGGTNTLYVSSISFRDIEAAMLQQEQVGFGRPSLRPAGASMKKENSLVDIVLAAPLAGVALASLRLCRNWLKARKP